MSYFIIIRGPLGSGKTTLAKKLAKELKAVYIPIDSILEKHRLDKVKTEKWIPLKNFIKANKIILPEAKKLLKNNKIVIFDACFYHKEQIKDLIKNLPYKNYIFTLKAPLEVCIKRDSKRSKNLGKAATKAVHKLVSRFDYGINIDITKPLNKAIKEVLSYLPKK